MVEFVDKEINEALNNELEAEESSSSKIKKAIYGDPEGKIRTFAIISADNPPIYFRDKVESSNKERRKDLEEILASPEKRDQILSGLLGEGKYQYIKQRGQYGSSERSYFIINLSLSAAKYLAGRVFQESFIFGAKTDNQVIIDYYETDGRSYPQIHYDKKDTATGIDLKAAADDFYSKRGEFKYSFHFPSFEEVEIIPCKDKVVFESSMAEGNSLRSQWVARNKIYK